MKALVWVFIGLFILAAIVVVSQQILHARQATQDDFRCLGDAMDVSFLQFWTAPVLFSSLYYLLCRRRRSVFSPAARLLFSALATSVTLTMVFWLWMRSRFVACLPGAEPPIQVFTSAMSNSWPLVILVTLLGGVWNYLRVWNLPRGER